MYDIKYFTISTVEMFHCEEEIILFKEAKRMIISIFLLDLFLLDDYFIYFLLKRISSMDFSVYIFFYSRP